MDDRRKDFSGVLGNITFRVSATSSDVHVKYRGLPADLLAAGAIETVMMQKGRKGYAQYDSNGDRYRRKELQSGKLEVTRMLMSFSRSRKLPGVPADISNDLIDWLDRHPGKIYTTRNVTICGKGAWLHHSGSREALDAAGIEGDRIPLMDGYYMVSAYEEISRNKWPTTDWPFTFPRETFDRLNPYDKAVVREKFERIVEQASQERIRQPRPTHLRLVVSNTRSLGAMADGCK